MNQAIKSSEKGASVCWKLWQVLLYLTAFACAVVAAVTLGIAAKKFDGRCPLYTDGSAHLTLGTEEKPAIDGVDDASIWEDKSTCDFCTFVPVVAATFGFVLVYFVIMFDTAHEAKGAAALSGESERLQENRMPGLFLPLLCTSVLLTIFMLISSTWTMNGTKVFCNGIQQALNLSCQEAQNLAWKGYSSSNNFYYLLLTSVTTTWISTCAFTVGIFLLLLRCGCGVDNKGVNSSKPVIVKKPKLRKLAHTESQQSLLRATGSTATSVTSPMEPLPGTSSDEPRYHLTVIT